MTQPGNESYPLHDAEQTAEVPAVPDSLETHAADMVAAAVDIEAEPEPVDVDQVIRTLHAELELEDDQERTIFGEREAAALIDTGNAGMFRMHSHGFRDVSRDHLAELAEGGQTPIDPAMFEGGDQAVADDLIEQGRADLVATNIGTYTSLSADTAQRLIIEGQAERVLNNITAFEGVDFTPRLSRLLVATGNERLITAHAEQFRPAYERMMSDPRFNQSTQAQ